MAPATACDALARAKNEGNARFKAGDHAAAARLYSAAIDAARDPTAPEETLLLAQLHCNRAAALLKLHASDAARVDAARAAQLAPQWAKPHLRLAEVAFLHHEHDAALQCLATARRLAAAAADRAVAKEVEARQLEYEAFQRCQEHDNQSTAQAGISSEEALRTMLGAIDRGGQVFSSHTLVNGELQPRVPTPREVRPDELYEHARCLEDEVGDVEEALKVYERIAKMPVDRSRGWTWNRAIGDALAALGRYYATGTHYAKNDALALDYLTRAAALGSADGCNELGIIYMDATHGQRQNRALAKAYFRRAAEQGHEPAMLNLGGFHRKLCEFELAIRWAEAAAAHGVLHGIDDANSYRQSAQDMLKLEPAAQRLVQDCSAFRLCPGYVQLRLDHQPSTPTLAQLRTIKTPYGRRLLQAKKLMLHACEQLSLGELALGVSAAAQAYKFDDATLVFTIDDMLLCTRALERLAQNPLPKDPGLAHVLQPPAQVTDPTDYMAFWYALHEQFPDDYRIAACAAKAHSFVDGEDEVLGGPDAAESLSRPKTTVGLGLYSQAMKNLTASPNYDPREVDPNNLGFWFLSGLALYRVDEPLAAKQMLERFLEFAGIDGHRFGGEAHFLLGLIELLKDEEFDPSTAVSTLPTAAEHLRLGRKLQQRVPTFLRPKNRSTNEQMLEAGLRAASTRTSVVVDGLSGTPETSTLIVRGGDVLSGPSCHPTVQIPVSPLTLGWRKQRAEDVGEDNQMQPVGASPLSSKSAGRATARSDKHLKATSVDEIVSGVDDQTYHGCVLECVVVAPLWKIRSSYQFIVEDSRRDPIQVVLKVVAPECYNQLTPGRVLCIRHPRLRHNEDQAAVLLVRDAARELEICGVRVICWNCGVAPADQEKMPVRSCSQCHCAKYCSRECQKEDWKLYGHRFCCSPRL